MITKEKILFNEDVYQIVGAALDVHKELGPGFLEAIYQEALAIELKDRSIPFVEQPRLSVHYKEVVLKRYYEPDYLVFGKIIVEIKAMKSLGRIEEAQILNSIRSSGMRVGVLINFGELSLVWKRFVFLK